MGFTTRLVLMIFLASTLAGLSLANEEKSDSNDLDKEIYALEISHWDGYRLNEDGTSEGVEGWEITPRLIESSIDLVTEVSKLPEKFDRPESAQNIFRKGEWALIASPFGEGVMSTDGQLTVDISTPIISFTTSNWKPTADIRLAFRLTIDDEHELQSEYRTFKSNYVAHWAWQNATEEFMKALEEGESVAVNLIDEEANVIHDEEFSLAGFSDNVIALRKLLKDSPVSESDD